MQKSIIRRSNEIIGYGTRLSIMEQRIIFFLLAQIDKDDKEFQVYKIRVTNLAEIFQINTKAIYDVLEKTSSQLLRRTMTLKTETGILFINWLSSAEYKKGSGTIELCFDPKLKPYLLNLKNCFTTYELREINSFCNKYSWRIYELCKQYLKFGCRKISVSNIKKCLDIEGKYEPYKNFKGKILEPTVKEINEKTSLHINYHEIKFGRKVSEINFRIWEKKSYYCEICKGKGYTVRYARFGDEVETVKTKCKCRS